MNYAAAPFAGAAGWSLSFTMILETAGKTRIVLSDTPIFRKVAGYLCHAAVVRQVLERQQP